VSFFGSFVGVGNALCVQYKAIDRRFRSGMASNCIHAIIDLDTDNGLLHTERGRGDAASHRVVQHLRHWVIDPRQTHPWVARRLGLGGYPVSRPDLD
jgi:hypothetical protein